MGLPDIFTGVVNIGTFVRKSSNLSSAIEVPIEKDLAIQPYLPDYRNEEFHSN